MQNCTISFSGHGSSGHTITNFPACCAYRIFIRCLLGCQALGNAEIGDLGAPLAGLENEGYLLVTWRTGHPGILRHNAHQQGQAGGVQASSMVR